MPKRTKKTSPTIAQSWARDQSTKLLIDLNLTDRQLRLFAVGCCLKIWHLIDHPDSKNAVNIAERFADGMATHEELASASDSAWASASDSAWAIQGILLESIAVLPAPIEPEWLNSTVIAIATGIYSDRAFDRCPILADAIQDAGCEVPAILDRLRHGEHWCKGDKLIDNLRGLTPIA